MATRYNINDFALANPAYVGGTVTFYTVSGGAKTTTKATLYAASTGSTTLANPRTLDSDGKFSVPVYVEVPTIATVSGLTIADHDTGIMGLAENANPVQAVEATPYTTYSSTTELIPDDDTIPQNSEGTEIITVSITPTSVSSRLLIECHASFLYAAASALIQMALFQDNTADALAVSVMETSTGRGKELSLRHEMEAGTITATTFKIRVGRASSGTLYINGYDTGRRYGGISAVRLRVTEMY